MGLSSRDLCMSLLPNGVNPCDTHRRLTIFLIILYQQKHCQLGLKGTEGNVTMLLAPQSRGDEKQSDKATYMPICITFHEKGRAYRWKRKKEEFKRTVFLGSLLRETAKWALGLFVMSYK